MSRAAFEGATSFGTAVTGVNNKELNTLRSLAGNLQDHKQAGKSLTLSLMLAPTKDLDPSIGATWLPQDLSPLSGLLYIGLEFELVPWISGVFLKWKAGYPVDPNCIACLAAGSIKLGDMGPWASGGWAVVALSKSARALREVSALLCGPLFSELPTINEADLAALLECLKHACPPFVLHTDSKYVFGGVLSRGRVHTTHVLDTHCFVWREVWARLGDWGFDGSEFCEAVRFVKVLAHSSSTDVRSGRGTTRDKFGNDMADRHAKWAAQAVRLPPLQAAAVASRIKVLKSWVRSACVFPPPEAMLSGCWSDDDRAASIGTLEVGAEKTGTNPGRFARALALAPAAPDGAAAWSAPSSGGAVWHAKVMSDDFSDAASAPGGTIKPCRPMPMIKVSELLAGLELESGRWLLRQRLNGWPGLVGLELVSLTRKTRFAGIPAASDVTSSLAQARRRNKCIDNCSEVREDLREVAFVPCFSSTGISGCRVLPRPTGFDSAGEGRHRARVVRRLGRKTA
ncbi:unnamed protein product [Prorocentrum cordatum]|uniref:RNase H type-1 domain-containing protein n=1 Tax=Prorocentrum cordatum TaxID=2364126 RepID=A0ABN9SA54_9DINO|nr:unnamed protein product [Polarella glacialis]